MNQDYEAGDFMFPVIYYDDEKNSNYESDSETGLQIDVAEVNDNERPTKRRRLEVTDMMVLDEVEEELERQLDAKAAKTNLTAINVKNIIKHVITNEHVLAMVNNSIYNSEEAAVFEPKLTRAKAKELAMTQPNIPWSLTPAKKTKSSKVQALIDQELEEDSSDEEYKPDQDQHSEDEGECNVTLSDIDSEPSMPAVPVVPETTVEELNLPEPEYDIEGLFKIPEIPHVPTEEENIGQRTRSKLSLSEIPIEAIEKAFVPPDITLDMYDWDNNDKDPAWIGFLNNYTNPEAEVEDDTEADPEYNILEDHDEELFDKEEFRADKAVKIPRKELNDLIAEMVEFVDIYLPESNDATKKKKATDEPETLVENIPQMETDIPIVHSEPNPNETELSRALDEDFRALLNIQFQQHIQLMTQHFLMTYKHPKLHSQSVTCEENLDSIKSLKKDENSAFNIFNLDEALKTVQGWKNQFKDEQFSHGIITKMVHDSVKEEELRLKKTRFLPRLHPRLKNFIMGSKALLYPHLLPHQPFSSILKPNVRDNTLSYFPSEIQLLGLGVSDFCPYIESHKRRWKKKMLLMDAAQLIAEYLMPVRKPSALYERIVTLRASREPNPVKMYFKIGSIPPKIHYIVEDNIMVEPKYQPLESLPKMWQDYIQNNDREENESYLALMSLLSSSTDNMVIDSSFCTPTVNMLTNTSTRESAGKKSAKQTANSTGNKEDSEAKEGSSSGTTSVQTRKTTPRLAKIRSAQNMKLMTQVSGSKNLSSSNSESIKLNDKEDSVETFQELTGSSKGDNEDEIAELMLASTTIKKDTINRKKAKQARESENIKRMYEAEKESEERATKFAESFLQKLHITLESSNPESLRLVLKLYLDYYEKYDKITEGVNETREQQEKISELLDQLAINLYKDVNKVLKDYPELSTVFLLFLKPHQAAMIYKSTEHMMLQKMNEFINAAQVYFAKQPSRMMRVMQALTQLAAEANPTLELIHATMDPILKGHQLIMDMFQQVLPTGKPPQSLFSPSLFENLTCPVLPHDKNRIFTVDSPELYENIELPTPAVQDDHYGGDNCKCDCHDTNEPHLKTRMEHCISCGIRYLNGRLYLQTPEGLRPAKVEFPGDEEEKLENISRVSLKTTDKNAPTAVPSTSRRRKSSKNDINTDEQAQKQCSLKTSPVKDNDDSDKGMSKSKRGGKSPPKSLEHRRLSKSAENNANSNVPISSSSSSVTSTTNEVTYPLKSKREKRAERREAKAESKNFALELNKLNEMPVVNNSVSELTKEVESNKEALIAVNDCGIENNLTCDIKDNPTVENVDDNDKSNSINELVNNSSWTRQEDSLLLQHIQKDYSESTFITVSQLLGNRTVTEVKERCQALLALLEKML
ncbi:GON-4-like protein [Cotesia glomerata]|uniref:Myb-like domain-containing protein n=1 Tax=Cotesia glomerata TaxID=32391 RepID=A0AAV7ITZ9_COTGL|nr:GON-4-like protein [Cotesia glomerata]KAH0568279.1 hypothetical protein KQX54_019976 [Cotesia glomerata]